MKLFLPFTVSIVILMSTLLPVSAANTNASDALTEILVRTEARVYSYGSYQKTDSAEDVYCVYAQQENDFHIARMSEDGTLQYIHYTQGHYNKTNDRLVLHAEKGVAVPSLLYDLQIWRQALEDGAKAVAQTGNTYQVQFTDEIKAQFTIEKLGRGQLPYITNAQVTVAKPHEEKQITEYEIYYMDDIEDGWKQANQQIDELAASAGIIPQSGKNAAEKPDVNPVLLTLTNWIMLESDFDPSGYTVGILNLKYHPYEVLEYYRTMDRGSGSTRPVIYSDQKNHTYYIVYQQGDGVNVIDELVLSGEENATLTSSR